jgi:hypothetical protein
VWYLHANSLAGVQRVESQEETVHQGKEDVHQGREEVIKGGRRQSMEGVRILFIKRGRGTLFVRMLREGGCHLSRCWGREDVICQGRKENVL